MLELFLLSCMITNPVGAVTWEMPDNLPPGYCDAYRLYIKRVNTEEWFLKAEIRPQPNLGAAGQSSMPDDAMYWLGFKALPIKRNRFPFMMTDYSPLTIDEEFELGVSCWWDNDRYNRPPDDFQPCPAGKSCGPTGWVNESALDTISQTATGETLCVGEIWGWQ